MKQFSKAYLTFSRPERRGIAALLLIIVILLVVRFTMHMWVQPPVAELINIEAGPENKPEIQTVVPTATAMPAGKINLNTADSLTLISLKGIGKGLSHRILERRRQLGKFTSMEEVLDVYHFNEETKEMLLNKTNIE